MTADFAGQRVDLALEADFRLGRIDVRPSTRQIESGGTSETLEPRIMQVVVALARKRSQVVSRDELIETCWEGRVVGDDALNRCISKIRKLGEAKGDFRLETIPRVGYRLHVAGEAPHHASGAAAHGIPRRRWLIPIAAGAGLLLVAVAGLAWWINLNSRTVNVAAPLVMAVLLFDAPDGDKQAEALAAAIQPALVDELRRANVTVVSSARSAPFTGQLKSKAAGELGASILVDGSIVRNANAFLVFVRIDHTKSGVTLLARSMDSNGQTAGDFVYRLCANIAVSLSWSAAVEILSLDRPDAAEIAALWLNQSGNPDPEAAFAIARQLKDKAPDLQIARTAFALRAMGTLGPNMTPEDRVERWREARESAEAAYKLPSGGAAIAMMLVTPAARWEEREGYLVTASKADTRDGSQVRQLSWLYLATGQIERSRWAIKEARSRNPISPNMIMQQAITQLAANKLDGVREMLDLVDRRAGPNFAPAVNLQVETAVWWATAEETRAALSAASSMPASQFSTAKLAQVRLVAAAAKSRAPKDVEAVRAACDAAAGDRAVQLICLSAGGGLGAAEISIDAANHIFPDMRKSLSDPNDAGWLEASDIVGPAQYLFMPWMASVRSDPQIIGVFDRVGLLTYWRETKNWPDFCDQEDKAAVVCKEIRNGS